MTYYKRMKAANDNSRWEYGAFRILGPGGSEKYKVGYYWRYWGISSNRRTVRVYHLPSGQGVTAFSLQRHARRWCERVDAMADWSQSELPSFETDNLGLRMHRAALDITGGNPGLQAVTPQ